MNRRRTLQALVSALALPCVATARTTASRPMRITVFVAGVLPGDGFNSLPWHRRRTHEAFAKAGLRDGGNVTIQYVAIEEAPAARIEAVAREVVALRPDVIFAIGSEIARFLQGLTRDIPVVFAFSPDPLREGLVQSYRRPGGNLTGTSSRWYELLGKRLELVKEIRPDAQRVALLMGKGEFATHAREQLSSDASRLGLTLVDLVMPKGEVGESESPRTVARATVVDVLRRARAAAFLPIYFFGVSKDLVWIQAESLTPGFFSHPGPALGGGLVSLGISERDHLERAAAIVARIVGGENPAVIPVDQESSFNLIVNLSAARLLKIVIPPSVRLRANRLVE